MGTARRGLRSAIAVTAALSAFAAGAAGAAGTAAGAEFGVTKWEAGTCTGSECTEGTPSLYYTQAAGHPPFGITDFRFATAKELLVLEKPVGHVEDVRVDLPPGLAVDPEAVPACSEAQIEKYACPPETQVGIDEAVGAADGFAVKQSFPAYNVQRRYGESARVGIEVHGGLVTTLKLESVIYLHGSLSWHQEAEAAGGETREVATGDYHEYFRILKVPREPELIESRLVFWGVPYEYNGHLEGTDKAFITMPSACDGPQVTWLHVDSYENPGSYLGYQYKTPVGATGCGSLAYQPVIGQEPESSASDAPDGTQVFLHVPQATEHPQDANSPDLRDASVTLPAGMTLNPSAANDLEACSNSQFGIGTDAPIACPSRSVIGSVSVNAPGIPDGALTGSVYLGTPESQEPASGREYRIFVAAEAPAYDIGVRLEGHVHANPQTGSLTTTFSELPAVPFEEFRLHFKGGPSAPLANPLSCGAASTSGEFFPYSAAAGQAPVSAASPFTVIAPACPPPFAIAQSAVASSTKAGSGTSFTLGLTRPEGKQYMSSLSTTLPAGLIGEIPAVPLCDQAQAAAQKCPAASQIGTASVTAGSGSDPLALPAGPVYLTGPYDGAPFGMEVLTDASKVGPFDYGTIVTRAKIEIDPYTARVTVSAALPTIVGGAPVRLRSLSVNIDHPGFVLNPTSCGALATETSLVSTLGATDDVSTPFQASGCEALAFAPKFSVSTGAHHTRRFGARLTVSVTARPGDANIRSVKVMLPKKIVADTETLKYACPAATFQANPASCPQQSRVGHAEVSTPALPGVLTGHAYFVSHGGAGFPNLDVVLNGDGVTVILVGDTIIKGRYTHSTFASLPDVPIASFSLSLPTGSHPALDGYGNFCKSKMRMPITIVGQNGKSITRRPRIAVAGCKRKPAKRRKSKRRHGARKRRLRGAR